MKARLLTLPLTVVVFSAACFPGYKSQVVTGEPKVEFVKSDKKEVTTKADVKVEGQAVNVSVVQDTTCYGNQVTTTSQKRVYHATGVSPAIGIAAGVVSAALFGVMFANGICDASNPHLFDFSHDGSGVATSLGVCDLTTAVGTLVGFSGTLAYGVTSIKSFASKPKEEEMTPEQTSKEATQDCGSEPVINTPLLVYMPSDKSLSYAWPDSSGNVKFDLSSLLDPSVSSGKALIAFATAPDKPIYTVEAEQLAGSRPPTWSPAVTSGTLTGEAMVTRAHYDLSDASADVRQLTLAVKLQNAGTAPLRLRARLTSDNPGVNGRTIIWDPLPAGAEQEKTLTIQLPKALPDPSKLDVFIVNNTGGIVAKVSAKTGAEEPPAATGTGTKGTDTKGTGATGTGTTGTGAKGTDTKGTDTKGTDTKGTGTKGTDTKGTDTKGTGTKPK